MSDPDTPPSYTPGPWYVCRYDPAVVLDGVGREVADCSTFETMPLEEAANARLVAAAPELLAAIEQLIDYAQPDNWDEGNDPDQAAAWRSAFCAMCAARGLPVPPYLRSSGEIVRGCE